MEKFDFEKMSKMPASELKDYVDGLYSQKRGNIVFGYCRVSTRGQAVDGNSLDGQEAAVRQAGATQVYRDTYSGAAAERPELNRLLESLHAGDTIIVTKLDRIARSAVQGAALISDLLERGVTVNVLNMGLIDKSPTGKLMMHILLSFAEFERDMILERTREGKRIAQMRDGYREGRPSKFSQRQIQHAVDLLNDYSYNQVVNMTGISKATLIRAKKKLMNGTGR